MVDLVDQLKDLVVLLPEMVLVVEVVDIMLLDQILEDLEEQMEILAVLELVVVDIMVVAVVVPARLEQMEVQRLVGVEFKYHQHLEIQHLHHLPLEVD